MESTRRWSIIGIMSGSSLDGIDLAAVDFVCTDQGDIRLWKLRAAETVAFSADWQEQLRHLPQARARDLARIHSAFGQLLGGEVQAFIERHQLQPNLIASHGHTIFHEPESLFTTQIGDGAAIAALSGLPVVSDFRSMDIAMKGQGAPFAPMADRLLYTGYDFYLNIGGIANISAITPQDTLAFDIAPANQVFNYLAGRCGQEMDEGGAIAASGTIQPVLYKELIQLPYFQAPYPKSMDNNWVQREVLPIFEASPFSLADQMRTAVSLLVEHTYEAIATIIRKERFQRQSYSMLLSGGGAFNHFLLTELRWRLLDIQGLEITLPDAEVIAFKEAVLMALLGLRRVYNLPTSFASVTGAGRDPIGGCIYQGWKKQI